MARIAVVLVVILTVGLLARPTVLVVPGYGHIDLPDGATWSALAVWVVTGSIFEAVLALRLGRLRDGSRRAILLAESLVIALSGLYAAAGLELALLPLVWSIATVVLLRLDHVRHSFERATAERRIVRQDVHATLFEGYRVPDVALTGTEVQRVGYRAGIDCAAVESAGSGMSRA